MKARWYDSDELKTFVAGVSLGFLLTFTLLVDSSRTCGVPASHDATAVDR